MKLQPTEDLPALPCRACGMAMPADALACGVCGASRERDGVLDAYVAELLARR